MSRSIPVAGFLLGCALWLGLPSARAQDWPQWRGPNRDAKATGFKAPAAWPKELTQKWKVAVGDGVATPALVGDRLYVFTREGGDEVVRCLDAASGKELWQDKYEAVRVTGAAQSFPGPRSSPAVADRKVVTLGVGGVLSCYDAASGKMLWRKDDFKSWPAFFTSCSPIIVDGLCIVQLGGGDRSPRKGGGGSSAPAGGVVAYDLASGHEKWRWTGDGTAYSSPVQQTVDGVKTIVAETATKIVGIGIADGKLLWETPFPLSGMGYNAATPIVDGQLIVYSGTARGTNAVRIEKGAGGFAAKKQWDNPDKSVQFNTPVLKNGLLYGISGNNEFFCIKAQDGQTAWGAPAAGGGGRGRSGYGSIVDAGPVLFGLTPAGQLVVFEPSDKEFKPLASYKVAGGGTYAYPVIAGNRVFIKDMDSLTLWTIE
jgi:outer membrane protein assembly factor BamB